MKARGEQGSLVIDVDSGVAMVTLNRPAMLNALDLDMIRRLDALLQGWAADPAISAVVIGGAGERAFCAGGDILALDRARKDGNDGLMRGFFRDEYRLDRRIFLYPKPYVALLDGVVMGGGAGVAINGAYRVATENSVFAMPETGIGFFPDIGATWFLSRCPGRIGLYLALTGARLRAADMRYAGLATHYVPAERLGALLKMLKAASRSGLEGTKLALMMSNLAADPGPSELGRRRAEIDRCFAADRVEDIVAALAAEASDWANQTRSAMAAKSPTSLKVAARQIVGGGELDFDAALRREYRLSQRFMAGDDFFEGVRAAVIDKDRRPAWRPDSLEAVADAAVEAYFAPLDDGELEFGED